MIKIKRNKEEKRIEYINNQQNEKFLPLKDSILTIMIVLALIQTLTQFVDIKGMKLFTIYAVSIVLMIASCIVSLLKKYSKYIIPVLGIVFVIEVIIIGINNSLGGGLGCLNYVVNAWNNKFEDGIPLFKFGSISNQNIYYFSLELSILLIMFAIWLNKQKGVIVNGAAIIILVIPGVLLNVAKPHTSMIMLFAIIMNYYFKKEYTFRVRQIIFAVLICLIAFFVSMTLKDGNSTQSKVIREGTVETVEKIRYGTDTLPQGDIFKAKDLLSKKDKTLKIQTTQAKTMYFKGFVGSTYDNGKWESIKKKAFSGDNEGLMKWMTNNGFYPTSQFAEYKKADKYSGVTKNEIEITNNGANSKYVYAPYSATLVNQSGVENYLDSTYMSKGLFGDNEYSYTEWSDNNPTELLQASSWISSPQTNLQKSYMTYEKVYKNFVYKTYLDISDEFRKNMNAIFWKDAKAEEKKGIYNCTQRIRDVLTKRVEYKENPKTSPNNIDPIGYFLNKSKEGNSVQYASAAVMAFRAINIPTRYVEGYLLKEETLTKSKKGVVQLTNKDSHAWVEVYLSGVGWIPVDVTPGFYFDVYSLMKMVNTPKGIKQTAQLENSDQDSGDVENNSGGGSKYNNKGDTKSGISIIGIIVFILILLMIVILILEIRHYYIFNRNKNIFNNADTNTRVMLITGRIFDLLAVIGIEGKVGWQEKETDDKVRKKIVGLWEGSYIRINKLLEKEAYGECDLEVYELKTLEGFYQILRREAIKMSIIKRLRIRYYIKKRIKKESKEAK